MPMDRNPPRGGLGVVLVIRSPNLADADLRVSALWDWHVLRVKGAIAELCPGHPEPADQRLVYAGKLLQDWQTLDQVLRYDEHASSYTLHMVCRSPVQTTNHTQSQTSAPIDEGQSRTTPVISSSSTANSTVGSSSSSTDTPSPLPTSNPTSGTERVAPEHAWSELFHEQMHALQSHNPSPDQMIWWQTVCTQYMNQYMHYMQVTGAAPAPIPQLAWPPGHAQGPFTGPQDSFFPHMEPAAQAGQAHPPVDGHPVGAGLPGGPAPGGADIPQGAPEVGNAGPGGAIGAVANNDEGAGQRDALDWLDLATRAIVMFSLIYGYSSPGRILFVMIWAVLAYLWNVGYFRPRPPPLDPNNVEEDNLVQPQVEPTHEETVTEEVDNEHNVTDTGEESRNPADEESHENGEENHDQSEGTSDETTENPDYLATAYAFASTFFTSLLPEQYQEA